MEQYLHISGSATPEEGVILFSNPDSVAVRGKTCSGEEVFCIAEPQQGYQRRPWSSMVARSTLLPRGQVVAWTGIPRQAAATKKMRPELERLLDQVLVPILVKRYVDRLKNMNLHCGIAQ